jgi:hypothetical protein
LDLALAGLDLVGEGKLEVVQDRERLVAHDHDDAGLDDRDLLGDPGDAGARCMTRVGQRALHAEGAEDDDRVDREPLEALHQGVAGAPVEGHPLLDLGGGGGVLEHHDVRLGVAGALDRHHSPARTVLAGGQVPAQVVELADCPLEVLLADLVVRRR